MIKTDVEIKSEMKEYPELTFGELRELNRLRRELRMSGVTKEELDEREEEMISDIRNEAE